MDGANLNISSLKDRVSAKLKAEQEKSKNKPKKDSKKAKKEVKNGKEDKENNAKNANVKLENKKKSKNNQMNKKGGKKDKKYEKEKPVDAEGDEEDVMRREALELGATEDDLKLLKGFDDNVFESKDDEEVLEFSESKDSKSISKNDLESFIKQIGLTGQVVVGDDSEEGVEEDVEEDVEESEENEEYEESEENEENKEGEESKASSTQSKKKKETKESTKEVTKVNSDESSKQVTSNKEEMKKMTSVNSDSLLLSARLDWYNNQEELPVPTSSNLSKYDIDALYDKAKKITEAENVKYYEEFSKKSSQKKFFSDILTGGTLNDKISAVTLMIQEAPMYNLKSLDTILAFCSKKSRTAALQSITSFKDLLISGLLPSDRKLKHFKNQPLNQNLSDQQLMLFYFEDFLKNHVFKLLEVLERLSHDTVVHVKMSTISIIFELLSAKPEQEQNLLTLGVNKLGDIEHKVSAQTSYALLQLEQAHPAMKQIIVKAVIDFMNKNYDNYNSKYYSVLTLNQTILTRKEVELANALIKAYFSLFKRILVDQQKYQKEEKTDEIGTIKGRKPSRKNFKKGKKGGKSVKPVVKTENDIKEEQNSKLFSAVLSGLNRAFPFSDLPNELYNEQLDSLYKIVHSSNFNTTIQALSLINHIVGSQGLDNTRFYKSLYESLLDERLVNSSKQGLYLNLLYKALKDDKNLDRVLAFIKRIIQVCFNWLNIGAVSGMLYLLIQLAQHQPAVKGLVNKEISRETDSSEEEATEDTKTERVYDFTKRDPRYANADKTSLWEIVQFLNHFHPSVKMYANGLFKGAEEDLVKPDLGLYTLSHFLDKFVYKNPKQKTSTKGTSIMQPLGGAQTGSLLVRSTNLSRQDEIPVNLKDWFNKRLDDISPEDRFFHEFFKNRKHEPKNLHIDAVEDDQESELDDDEVWKALVSSRPDIDGDGDDFSDEDISFGEDAFDSDNGEDAFDSDNEENADLDAEFEAQLDEAEAEAGESDESLGEDDLQAFSEEEEEDDDDEDDAFKGFSEDSEDDRESAALFKQDDEDELSSDEDIELESKSRKRSSKQNDKKRAKKQKMKDLPTFASAEDYAQYLGSDSE